MSSGDGPRSSRLVAELAETLDGVTSVDDAGLVSYQRGGVTFARVSADALELRLPEDIAEAAARTPDTVALPGPVGWVRLAPLGEPRGDASHAVDRATAWFQTAWRHAAKG
jgi:hypothetical protein